MQKLIGKSIAATASLLWQGAQFVNRRFEAGKMHPPWAPEPLLKSKDRSFPQLGFPRQTDSLCPDCVMEVRRQILAGEVDWQVLVDGKPGEIKAEILEKDGGVVMRKTCPKHGTFEDVMAIDARWLRRVEDLYPGRDFKIAPDPFHNHGTSSIRYGRGAVLTVDLTNRCNMMCNPCFMDANQVGYVHELTWEEVREILDHSIQVKPRRQMSLQFSGGEPTISPLFLDAIRYARQIGYFSVQCATNGIRFAQDAEFATRTAEAGLRLVYLQFDGVGDEDNQHRKVGNLYQVKQKAIDNLHAAGIDVTLVVTIIKTVNDHQVGPIINFAIDNIDKINAVSFQPVSFTGRDEEISTADRVQQRYTLSHLAHDVKKQTGYTEPMRDWFPLSASGPFSDLKDLLGGLEAQWGSLKCGCHPNCGIGTMLLVNEKTHEIVPVSEVLNIDQLLEDLITINDAGRKKPFTVAQVALALARNYMPPKGGKGLSLPEVLKILDGHTGGKMGIARHKRYEWRVLLVAGMWFQDLFNYDFRRTEMCIIPYGTQLGEISFCAYNTGVGWRKIIEEMKKTATVAQWYKENGRHVVYAGGKNVPLPSFPGEKLASLAPVSPVAKPPGFKPLPMAAPAETAAQGCGCQ